MPTITRKIELKLCTEGLSDQERKDQWNMLYHINDNLYRAANNISSKLYLDDHVGSMVRLKHAEYLSMLRALEKARKQKAPDEDVIAELSQQVATAEQEMDEQAKAICQYATEMSTQTLSYRFATELETNIFAKILDCLKQGVFATFNSDARDVKRGERSIRTYKKGMPIPFAWNDSLRIELEDGEFYLRWYNGLRFRFDFGKDRSNNRLIVRRCLKMDEDTLQNQCRLFGPLLKLQNDKVRDRMPTATVNENVLQQLPSTFTIDDLRRLKGSECADGTLYSILSRWKAEGWIEKVDKNNWKKA